LVDAGLSHINISLDTLNEATFLDMTRRPGLQQVYKAIEHAAATLPHGRVKINCVVMKDVNEHELMDFALLTQILPVDVRFIEWMPFNNNGWNANRFVSYQSMMERLAPLTLQRVPDGPNDTTKWWTLGENNNNNNSLGRIGFITSMSQHFCSTCNRLRLTADGQIKVCLFGSTELSLRDAMRAGVNQEELEKLIYYAIQKKHAVLGGHGTAQGIADANDNRPMTLIGG
jgi:cyclic pyranopterin phosphate synthase